MCGIILLEAILRAKVVVEAEFLTIRTSEVSGDWILASLGGANYHHFSFVESNKSMKVESVDVGFGIGTPTMPIASSMF